MGGHSISNNCEREEVGLCQEVTLGGDSKVHGCRRE